MITSPELALLQLQGRFYCVKTLSVNHWKNQKFKKNSNIVKKSRNKRNLQ